VQRAPSAIPRRSLVAGSREASCQARREVEVEIRPLAGYDAVIPA
jgi:hypothetical protein